MEAKRIRVAAVQASSDEGDTRNNLARVAPLVSEACAKGAQFVLLPEFLSTGYRLERSIWDRAEPANGITAQWLVEQARKHAVWIGTSFLEASGSDFYNSFVLIDPKGKEVLRTRKSKPAATEAYYFRGDRSGGVVDTPLGRIGVSICYEAALFETVQALYRQGADWVLMPMSAPTPTLNKPLSPADIDEYNDAIRNLASDVSIDLGVPTLMANKVGRWRTKSPWPFPLEESRFLGCSTICDAGGIVRSQMGDEEGVIVAEIELDARSKANELPASVGKWARKPPRLFNLLVIAETLGKISYLSSTRRRRVAQRVSMSG